VKTAASRREAIVFALLAAALFLASIVGRPNADEGWYLHACRRVFDGDLLYRDFAFTQAPLLPYVYGAVQEALPGPRLRLGRATSCAFVLAAAWAARALARRIAGESAGWLALVFILASPDLLYYGTLVKTYALSSFLLALSAALAFDGRASWRAWAPLPAGLAAATRLSLLPAAGALLLLALYGRRERLDAAASRRALIALLLGLAPLALALADPRAFVDQAIRFHLEAADAGTLAEQIREVNRMHWALRIATIAGLISLWIRERRTAAWLTMLVPVVVLPNVLPAAHHAEHVELAMPLAAGIAASGIACLPGPRALRRFAAPLFAALVLAAGVARAHDCYGFRDLDARAHRWNPVRSIEEAAAAIDSLSAPGDTLLTWCTIAAVEARRPVPRGLDMAQFSARLDPEGDLSAALRRDPESFARTMASRFSLLFWERGLTELDGSPDGVWSAAWASSFAARRDFPGFGQWQTRATLFTSSQTGPARRANAGSPRESGP
jgi:hypothetical protein